MTQKRNKKRKPRAATPLAVTVVVAAVTGLSALGLWHCLDGSEPGPAPVMRRARTAAAMRKVDVGRGRTVDPTLVRESELLKAGEPAPDTASEPATTTERPPDAGAPAAADTDAMLARFPAHAVAYEFLTQIRNRPAADARIVGYARRGSTFRVGERVPGPGCAKGWREIATGGLYACEGGGIIVSDQPVTFEPSPPAADLSAPMPYRYAYVTADDTPEYWRIPTADEARGVASLFSGGDFERAARDRRIAQDKESRRALDRALHRAAALGSAADGGPPPAPEPRPRGDDRAAEPDAGPGAAPDESLPSFVHLRMAKGFFVSLDDEVTSDDGVSYQRTLRGRFVASDRLAPARPSAFESRLVDSAHPMPRAFAVASGVKSLLARGASAAIRTGDAVARLAEFPFGGEVQRGDRLLAAIGPGAFLPRRAVAVAAAIAPPAGVKPGERWIDVNLTEQTLVAYEGEVPVFATVVSTGRPGFETPEGSFAIYAKHVTVTMDDTAAGAEAYSIEDVPWTMFFKDSIALHAAFWHDKFGRVHSHGCVNLAPADARRLFFWVGPTLPAGLHGIVATRENPGTRVIVHK